MSVENVKQFGKLMAENEDIKQKVYELGAENIAPVIAYAEKEHGLSFTEADVNALTKDAQQSKELSDDQLEALSGGYSIISL